MSKNREVKRRRKMQKKRCRAQAAPKRQPVHRENSAVASAQTMWRTMHLNFRVQETLIATTMDLQPSLWKRDANKIHRIEQAIGLEAVLDLAPSASGLAEYAWLKRLLGFGCHILAFDIVENESLASEPKLKYCSLEEVLKNSDIVTLHAPLMAATREMIGA